MRRALAPALAAVALAASGCGFSGLYGVPLPGGPDTGDDPYRVTAYFRDVLDLVPQANVKVADVGVGKIETIEAVRIDGAYAAKVVMVVHRDVTLPSNAEAAVRQTSLLGEKFVELRPPSATRPSPATLTDGSEIPIERTQRNAEVEEVLGAFSMLINGGGVEQIQSIVHELNAALAGNEPQINALLSDLDTLFAGLDAQKNDITRAIEGLNTLSITVNGNRDQLLTALDRLQPGLQVLSDQRTQLVGMLQAIERLGGVATDVVNRSRDDVIADLRALQPTLTELARAGDNLPKSLELLLTFPFPDNAVDAIRGDYANLDVTIDLDLRTVLDNLGSAIQPPAAPPPAPPPPPAEPRSFPVPGLPDLTGLLPAPPAPGPPAPGLPGLPLPGGPTQPSPPGQGAPPAPPNIFDDLFGLLPGSGP